MEPASYGPGDPLHRTVMAIYQLQVIEGAAKQEHDVALHVDRGCGADIGLHVPVQATGHGGAISKLNLKLKYKFKCYPISCKKQTN